jgi:hypothetical protein
VAPKAVKTAISRKQRADRIAAMMELRLKHWSLAEIGKAQTPPISGPRVWKIISEAIDETVREPADKLREIEALRLDRIAKALWDRVEAGGDMTLIDRYLAVMQRRARLLGLDKSPSGMRQIGGPLIEGVAGPPMEDTFDESGVRTIRIEVIGNPEASRRKPPEPEPPDAEGDADPVA